MKNMEGGSLEEPQEARVEQPEVEQSEVEQNLGAVENQRAGLLSRLVEKGRFITGTLLLFSPLGFAEGCGHTPTAREQEVSRIQAQYDAREKIIRQSGRRGANKALLEIKEARARAMGGFGTGVETSTSRSAKPERVKKDAPVQTDEERMSRVIKDMKRLQEIKAKAAAARNELQGKTENKPKERPSVTEEVDELMRRAERDVLRKYGNNKPSHGSIY
jgi:hypothetical protein